MVTHHLQKEPRSGVCFTSPDDLPPSFGRITPDLQHNPTASTQSTISFSRWRGHEFCLCYQSRSFYFWVYFSLMSKNQIQLGKKLSQYLIKILISWFIWKWFWVNGLNICICKHHRARNIFWNFQIFTKHHLYPAKILSSCWFIYLVYDFIENWLLMVWDFGWVTSQSCRCQVDSVYL